MRAFIKFNEGLMKMSMPTRLWLLFIWDDLGIGKGVNRNFKPGNCSCADVVDEHAVGRVRREWPAIALGVGSGLQRQAAEAHRLISTNRVTGNLVLLP